MKFYLTFSALKEKKWKEASFASFIKQGTAANDVEEIKEKYQVLRMQRVDNMVEAFINQLGID